MNKKLKLTIIIISILILVTAIGCLAFVYISDKKEKERLEAERIAYEQQLQREQESYDNFLKVSDSFYPNSFLNNNEISGMTPDEVIEAYKNDFNNEKLTIIVEDTGDEESLSFAALNINYENFIKYVNNSYKNQEISKEEFLGEASRKDYAYDFINDIDMDAFTEENLSDFFSDNVAMSRDAYVLVDPESGEVTIEPEVFGNEVSFDILKEKVAEALSTRDYTIKVTSDDYIKPDILSDDPLLSERKATLEKVIDKEISIKLCGEITSLSGKELWSILDGSDDLISDKAYENYISKVKSKYDSCYFNRPFTTSYGDEITLEHGNYGWVIDAGKTKEIIAKAVTSSSSKPSVEVAYSRYGQRPALHEFNDTYIEVSISGQHVWAYVNGECLLSDDIISGEITTNDPETTTNRGVFRLSYKQLKAVLRGADYEEPVTYWMPFDGGIGFHDATWRDDSEFGGETYMGNGSHGCVNMRLSSAAVLFDIIDKEIPIIVW